MDLIAHSIGGLVCRFYLQHLGGARREHGGIRDHRRARARARAHTDLRARLAPGRRAGPPAGRRRHVLYEARRRLRLGLLGGERSGSLARPAAPEKTTSPMFLSRSNVGLCSPSTQRTASTMFDLPHPLGPMIADTSPGKVSSTASGNDLKPTSFSVSM